MRRTAGVTWLNDRTVQPLSFCGMPLTAQFGELPNSPDRPSGDFRRIAVPRRNAKTAY
jgi:hypothetical protein